MTAAEEPVDAARVSARRRLVVLLALGVVPWTVLFYERGVSMVFPWALVNTPPLGVTTLYDYVFTYTTRLPPSLQAWPVSTILYACALASASGTFWWREDRRLTAGLLVFAGLSHLGFSLAVWHPSQVVVPVGPLLVALVVWRAYWPDLRTIVLE